MSGFFYLFIYGCIRSKICRKRSLIVNTATTFFSKYNFVVGFFEGLGHVSPFWPRAFSLTWPDMAGALIMMTLHTHVMCERDP